MELNAFSRRKLATKTQFSRKKDKEEANEREQWSQMHSVGERLLRSRDYVQSETDNAPVRGKTSRREKGKIDRKKEKESKQ